MALTQVNKSVASSAWTLLATAGAAGSVLMQVFGEGNLLVQVGSDPGSGDAAVTGRFVVKGYNQQYLELDVASGTTVYGRADRNSLNVSVLSP